MARNFLDPSTFTGPLGALDIFFQSLRKSLGYDALPGPTFFAKVLTPPLPLSSDQVSALFDTGAEGEANKKRIVQFVFKGRIDELHGNFLDDPCALATASDEAAKEEVRKLISQHTEFVGQAKAGAIPSLNDIVKVELRRSPTGAWDLQAGQYIEMVIEGGAPLSPVKACTNLQKLFGEAASRGAWSTVADAAPFTPSGTAKPIRSSVVPNPSITMSWEWLSPILPDGSVMTSGLRTQASQDQVVINYAAKEGITAGRPVVGTGEPGGAINELKARGYKIGQFVRASPSGYSHGGGGAFDISGANLGQIASAVVAASNDPDMKVSFRPFGTGTNYTSIIETSNNCVHVEISSVEQGTPEEVAAAVAKYVSTSVGPGTIAEAGTPNDAGTAGS